MPFTFEAESFTFTWIIERFSMCAQKKGEILQSPAFMADNLNGTEWYLQLYPRGKTEENYISYFIRYCGPDPSVTIGCTLSLVAVAGSSDISKRTESQTIDAGVSSGYNKFMMRNKLFEQRNTFLPNDTMTLRLEMHLKNNVSTLNMMETEVLNLSPGNDSTRSCRMIKLFNAFASDEMQNFKKLCLPFQCSARTRIHVEHKSVIWPIKKFSARISNQISFPVFSAFKSGPLLYMTFFSGNCSNDYSCARIEIHKDDGNSDQIFARGKITVLGGDNDSKEDEYFFGFKLDDVWNFLPFINVNKIKEKKELYLEDDILYLRCEFEISRKGLEYTVEHSNSVSFKHHKKNTQPSKNDLRKEIKYLYKDGKFCDISLCVGDQTYYAHKSVLCARSPVFSAMFEHNTKEKETGTVDIVDVDPATLDHFLEFMYSDSLGDFDQETIMKLYCTADKYQVSSLKNQCKSFLSSNLCLSNVCEVLSFADMREDADLMETVRDFIYVNAKEIFNSQDWKCLMETNMKLACETMHRIWIKKLQA